MSLVFYLEGEEIEQKCICEGCGNKHVSKNKAVYFWANVTHNLCKMAKEAGVYECLWRPDENGFKYAKEIIHPLEKGLKELFENPNKFKSLEPENGWGSLDSLVDLTYKVVEACKQHPNAEIAVCR